MMEPIQPSNNDKMKEACSHRGNQNFFNDTIADIDGQHSSSSSKPICHGETVMDASHKETLQMCRDTLVENMIPDDLFNHLIANKILTQADVGRIKEKSTREAINEELVNNLVLRSDRAYTVFVGSLHKTLQGYLADILEKHYYSKTVQHRLSETKRPVDASTSGPRTKHSRPTVQQPPPENSPCRCEQIHRQIREMFTSAFDNISRTDDSHSSFERFRHELSQTNRSMKETLDVMNVLRSLCHHDSLTDTTDNECESDSSENTQDEPRQSPPTSSSAQCASCQQIQQIQTILGDAFKYTDTRDDQSGCEQFNKELSQKNKILKDSLEVMNALRSLCRHRDSSSVYCET